MVEDDTDNTTYFKVDPDGANPVKVSMIGKVVITGDLDVSGTQTVVNSTVNDADHLVLSPLGASTDALVVDAASGFSAKLLELKVNSVDKVVIDATHFTLGASIAVDMGANKVTNIVNASAAQDAVAYNQLTAEATARGDADTALTTRVNKSNTLLGAGTDAEDLGTFTGDIIPDASDVKEALQALEDAFSSSNATFVENAQDAVGAALLDTFSVDFTYDDTTNKIKADLLKADTNSIALAIEEVGGLKATLRLDGSSLVIGASGVKVSAIDADVVTVSNIETDNFKTGVIVTTVGATGSDTAIATEKAVRDAIAVEKLRAETTEGLIQEEIDAIETGAGLGAGGTYTANSSATYISAATSLKDADNKLDAAIKAESDELDAFKTASPAHWHKTYVLDMTTDLEEDTFRTVDSGSVKVTAASDLFQVYVNGARQLNGVHCTIAQDGTKIKIKFADKLKADNDNVIIDMEIFTSQL
jgi:hypothetical protein